jgi:hypothetical protein
MKFAPNHLYIEEYVKCTNCGVLIYEEGDKAKSTTILNEGKTYCSQWCLEWEQGRATGSSPSLASQSTRSAQT